MKLWILLAMAAVLLTGCGTAPVMETVADQIVEQPKPEPRAISVSLPGETAMPAMESDGGRIYMSADYDICIQTLPGGDLQGTIAAVSGFSGADMTVMTTQDSGCRRHEFVWAAAGEGGDILGRGVILDDGAYHYTMTVLRDADRVDSSPVVWDSVFSSFRLV